jgi:hypothetical protein
VRVGDVRRAASRRSRVLAEAKECMIGGMSTDDPATGRDVVFIPGRGYRAPLLRRAAIFLVLTAIAAFLAGSGVVPPLAWAAAAFCGAATLAQGTLYIWQGRFRTRLSNTGIEAQCYFGHFIPWSEVTGLDIGGFTVPDAEAAAITGTPWNSPVKQPLSRVTFNSDGGYRGKLATIRVARRNGRNVLLRAPLVTSWQDDSGFDDKARVIGQWWHDYGQGPAGRER